MEGENQKVAIPSMPDCYRYSLDLLLKEVVNAYNLGINAIALFPLIAEDKKDNCGRESYNPDGLVPRAVKAIKKEVPEIIIITDVALDPFSIYGHDGIVEDGKILNDETLEVLVKISLIRLNMPLLIMVPSEML